MRPRITQIEAAFILEVLEKDKDNYQQLEKELDEKMKPLKITVSKACWFVRNYMVTTAQREFNYPDCAKVLCKLEGEQSFILRKLVIYKGLVAKYRQIAENKKGRGRYSMDTTDIDSNINHLQDKIFLGYKDYKMPLVVEAPKL